MSFLVLNGCHSETLTPDLVVHRSVAAPYKSEAIQFFRTHSFLRYIGVQEPDRSQMEQEFLDDFEGLVAEALKVLKVEAPEIDFVLMVHNSSSNIFGKDENSEASQKMVYKFLEKSSYHFIGTAGSALEHLTIDSWKEEMIRDCESVDLETDKLEGLFPTIIKNDAVLLFKKDYPYVPVTGVEAYPLHIVHQAMLASGTLEYEPDVFYNMMGLRDDIALARLILHAQKHKTTRVCVVVGAERGANLVERTKLWGCGGRFFQLLTEEDKLEPLFELEY